MAHKKYLLLLFVFYLFISTIAQESKWVNYFGIEDVSSITEEGDFVWIGTGRGGIVKINKLTSEKIMYNISNSPLQTNHINFIEIDQFGCKWIGTDQGIVKFDGENWTIFNDSNSGFSGYPYCLAIDDNNIKWIGITEGIIKYDDINWTIYTESNSDFRGKYIWDIEVDEIGNKWFGCYWGGLTKFDGTNWTNYNENNSGLPQNEVQCIKADKKGNIFIGTQSEGLVKFDGTTWSTFNTSNSEIPSNEVSCINISKSGELLLGSRSGLAKYDGNSWIIFNENNSPLPINFAPWLFWFHDVIEDTADVIWVATRFGLYRLNNLQWEKVYSSLPTSDLTCLTIDTDDKMWFGSLEYTGFGSYVCYGLIEFDGENWKTYHTSNSALTDNWIKCITIDKFNNKWIGTESGGLLKFDGLEWDVYNDKNSSIQSNNINVVAIDGKGMKWIGNASDGNSLIKLDDITNLWEDWEIINTSNSGWANTEIKCLRIGQNNIKWVGFRFGLSSYNDTNWTYHFTADITDIGIDEFENIWVGSKSGLSKFNGSDWTHYHPTNSGLVSVPVNCVSIDDLGNKWIGMNEGLVKYDDVTWDLYTMSNSGLPSNIVNSIALDNLGNKWIVTSEGLAVFNENGIVSVEDEIVSNRVVPKKYFLYQNYPNPFNPSTKIKYSIPKQSNVTIKVYDILGSEVATLVNKEQLQGRYEVEFKGNKLTSGIYFYRLQAGDFVETKKMLLMR